MLKTPLFAVTKALGGKMTEYSGWLLPVQYQGIVNEHLAVREAAGLFDVSHMGEIQVRGPGAVDFLQRMCTRDLSFLRPGRIAYTLFANENGGVEDDLLVYCLDDSDYLLVVNAANTDKDLKWLLSWRDRFAVDVEISDVSPLYAQIALQGPRSEAILQEMAPHLPVSMRPYRFVRTDLAGSGVLVSRTGYTGEDGFEIYLPPAAAPDIWQDIVRIGAKAGLRPAGLGARDSLRLEAGMPLYGHELSPDITPLEAGLDYFVSLDKEFFIGRDALVAKKAAGTGRRLMGLILQERAIARQGYKVYYNERETGQVTSGGFSPGMQKSICMALLENQDYSPDTPLKVEIRDRLHDARICPLPFYKRRRA